MKSQESFGTILKRLREAKGLSQQELAEQSGISRVQITRLENDTRAPLLATAQALSAALGVNCLAFEEAGREEPAKPAKRKPKKRGT